MTQQERAKQGLIHDIAWFCGSDIDVDGLATHLYNKGYHPLPELTLIGEAEIKEICRCTPRLKYTDTPVYILRGRHIAQAQLDHNKKEIGEIIEA
jgi:hypothetical protein